MDEFVQAPIGVTLGGAEFLLSPLTDGDVVELDRWVQSECVAAARASVPEEASQSEYDRVVGAACKAAVGLCSSFGEGRKALLTERGYARLTWTGLRAKHPGLTEQRVRALIKGTSREERLALVEAYQRVNNLVASAKQGNGPDPPAPG